MIFVALNEAVLWTVKSRVGCLSIPLATPLRSVLCMFVWKLLHLSMGYYVKCTLQLLHKSAEPSLLQARAYIKIIH